jgi:hypothetical protein
LLVKSALNLDDPHSRFDLNPRYKDEIVTEEITEKAEMAGEHISQGSVVPFYLEDVYLDENGKQTALLKVHYFESILGNNRQFCSTPSVNYISPLDRLFMALANGDQAQLAMITDYVNPLIEISGTKTSHLIVDLRNNRGGRLDNVKCLLDYILPQNRVYLTTKLIYEKLANIIMEKSSEQVRANQRAGFGHMPTQIDYGIENVTVVVNRESASAAEIFAGVIKGGFGQIVGETTSGKGLGQGQLIFHRAKDILFEAKRLIVNFTHSQRDSLIYFGSLFQFFLHTSDGSMWSPHLVGVEPDFLVGAKRGEIPNQLAVKERSQFSLTYNTRFQLAPYPGDSRRDLAAVRECVGNYGVEVEKVSDLRNSSDFQMAVAMKVSACSKGSENSNGEPVFWVKSQ